MVKTRKMLTVMTYHQPTPSVITWLTRAVACSSSSPAARLSPMVSTRSPRMTAEAGKNTGLWMADQPVGRGGTWALGDG